MTRGHRVRKSFEYKMILHQSTGLDRREKKNTKSISKRYLNSSRIFISFNKKIKSGKKWVTKQKNHLVAL